MSELRAAVRAEIDGFSEVHPIIIEPKLAALDDVAATEAAATETAKQIAAAL